MSRFLSRVGLCSVVLTLATLTVSNPAHADKNSQLPTKLGSAAAAVIEESFDQPLTDLFRAVKGQWEVTDEGVLKGKELAADKHAAVLNVNKKNRDSVVRVSFNFDGSSTGFHFSLNHKGGHLFRVVVSPSGVRVNLDKDKKDPKSKPIALGEAKVKFEAGQWYTLQVEMKDNRVVAQTDNGTVVEISHPKLDTEKPNYRFVTKGDSLLLDDLTVWEWE